MAYGSSYSSHSARPTPSHEVGGLAFTTPSHFGHLYYNVGNFNGENQFPTAMAYGSSYNSHSALPASNYGVGGLSLLNPFIFGQNNISEWAGASHPDKRKRSEGNDVEEENALEAEENEEAIFRPSVGIPEDHGYTAPSYYNVGDINGENQFPTAMAYGSSYSSHSALPIPNHGIGGLGFARRSSFGQNNISEWAEASRVEEENVFEPSTEIPGYDENAYYNV